MKIPVSRAALLAVPFAFGCLALAAMQDGTVRGGDHFEFTYRVTLPKLDSPALLWMPLAGSDTFQKVEVKGIASTLATRQIQDRKEHNLLLTASPMPDDSGKVIEVRYDVHRVEKAAYPAMEKDFTRFLQPDRLVPLDDKFRALAKEALASCPPDAKALARGRALYDHVLHRMKYDKSGKGWGRGDAVYACDARTGNCTDFHAYFIALARAAGIPARFAIGATIPADKTEGPVAGYHCWAEFMADGAWVPVDISEASQNPSLADYYFGHQPANRFELSRGRDLVVDPAPADGPLNFLVYPRLEAAGLAVPVKTAWSFRRLEH